MNLMKTTPYDEITVQMILDGANAGRTTFYDHFRNKDHLLVFGLEELERDLRKASEAERSLVGFSSHFFAHARDHKGVYRSLVKGSGWAIVRPFFQDMFSSLIKDRLTGARLGTDVPEDLLKHFLASTMTELVVWWMEKNSSLSHDEINEMYLTLVMPVIKEGNVKPRGSRT